MNENRTSCPRESETLAATRSGSWSGDLTMHVQSCEHCRSTQRLASTLGRLATESQRLPHRLPDHRVLWLRAQFEQRQLIARRFERLMSLGGGAVAAFVIAVIIIKWDTLVGVMSSMTASGQGIQAGSAMTLAALLICLAFGWLFLADRNAGHL